MGYNLARSCHHGANAVVRARIDQKTKKKTTVVLKSMGLTPSDTFRLLMTRVATEKTFPFDLGVLNEKTVEAMNSGLRGEVTRVSSVAELFEKLNADD